MKEIKYITGDATSPRGSDAKMIVHICNDIGAWGKGFVLAISKKWPQVEKRYRELEEYELGSIQGIRVSPDIWVINMIAQRGIRRRTKAGPPIRHWAVKEYLQRVSRAALELKASIHMPRIGCGLAGGAWPEIERIVTRELCDKGVSVYVYDLPHKR